MSNHERREELFSNTMERLARMGFGDAAGITKTHIIVLAEEIEGYRDKISALEMQLEQAFAEKNRIAEEQVRHPAELEVEDLREAIIRQIKASYNIGPYPPGVIL